MLTTSRKRSIPPDKTVDIPRPAKQIFNGFSQSCKLRTGEQMATDTDSAVYRVLRVPEILEEILLYMDFKTLLLAQRTGTQFQGTIDGSSKLQKKLFKRPVSSIEEAEVLDMIQANDIIIPPVYESILSDGKMFVNPHILVSDYSVGDFRGSRVLLFTSKIQEILNSGEAPEGRLGSRAQMYVILPAITEDIELVPCYSAVEDDTKPVSKNVSLPSRQMTLGDIVEIAKLACPKGHIVVWPRTWLYAGRYYKTDVQYLRENARETRQGEESEDEWQPGCICQYVSIVGGTYMKEDDRHEDEYEDWCA